MGTTAAAQNLPDWLFGQNESVMLAVQLNASNLKLSVVLYR